MLSSFLANVRSQWMGALALLLVLTGGVAYAANTVYSTDIVNGEVKTIDIATGGVSTADIATDAVTSAKIAPNHVLSSDVRDDTMTQGGLTAADLQPDSVGTSELGPDAVTSTELDDGAVGAADLAPNPKWHYVGSVGEPAFENGWENYDTSLSPIGATWQHVGFYRDNFGRIHLGGLLFNENGSAIPSTAFTLPEPYCPWFYHPFPVLSNDALGRVTVTFLDSGNCDVNVDTGSELFVSLDGISFRHYTEENSLGPAALERAIRRR